MGFRAIKGFVGQYLSGTITYSKDEIGKKADVYPFKYVLPEPSKKNKNSDSGQEKEKEKTKFEEYTEALRDLKVNWLGKMGKYLFLSSFYSFYFSRENSVLIIFLL